MSLIRRKAYALGGTVVLALLIVWGTLTPQVLPRTNSLPIDKLLHAGSFALYVLPSALFYPRALWAVLACGVLLGGGIELVQPLVGRSRDMADFLADIIGLAIGLGIGRVCARVFGLRSRSTS